jgi:uncharacterized protein YqeY
MSIKEELAAELRDALRAGDTARKNVIRAVETDMAMKRSDPGFTGEVDDGTYVEVMSSFVKRMAKARVDYEAAGDRGREMVDKIDFEIEYLSRWLPSKKAEPETLEIVRAAIAELGATEPGDTGRVMGHLMKAHKDELDGATVNRLVRQELAGD